MFMSSEKSMIKGWPDVIRCGVATSEADILWLHTSDGTNGNAAYFQNHFSDRHVVFNSDGSYNSRVGDDLTIKGCLGNSIYQLDKFSRTGYIAVAKEPDSTGDSTMFKGWPDAIRCGSVSEGGAVFWLNEVDTYEGKVSYYQIYSDEARYVLFNSDGTYYDKVGNDESNRGCLGQSIAQIYIRGDAMNAVSSKGNPEGIGIVEGWPDAIKCSNTDSGAVFMLRGGGVAGIEYAQFHPTYDISICFTEDGEYYSKAEGQEATGGCLGKSISQLREAKKTFYFVGAPTTTSTSTSATEGSVTDSTETTVTQTAISELTTSQESGGDFGSYSSDYTGMIVGIAVGAAALALGVGFFLQGSVMILKIKNKEMTILLMGSIIILSILVL
jgi:hypothetical protein